MNGDEIGDLYTNYYPRSSFDVEAWSPPREEGRLRVWWSGLKASAFRWVPRDVTILAVGCGFGEALGYHRARGCDAHGIAADRNILRFAPRDPTRVGQVKRGSVRVDLGGRRHRHKRNKTSTTTR